VTAIQEKMKQNFGISNKRNPDKGWLIAIIATYSPHDEIFEKSYMPPPMRAKTEPIKAISLPQNFLKNLPMTKPGKKLKRSRMRMMKDARLLEKNKKK